jgi:hypothetical protein
MTYFKIRLKELKNPNKIVLQCSRCPSHDFYAPLLSKSKKYYHLSK